MWRSILHAFRLISDPEKEGSRSHTYIPLHISLWIFAGLFVIGLFSYSSDHAASTFGVLMLLAGVGFLVGSLVGFLFGVPKSYTGQDGEDAPLPERIAGKPEEIKRRYIDNTNLEEVSDWLTKIIVGIGLAQVSSIGTFFKSLGDSVDPALGKDQAARLIAEILVAYFAVSGFLFSYLWARTELFHSMSGMEERLQQNVQRSVKDNVQEVVKDIAEAERRERVFSDFRNALDHHRGGATTVRSLLHELKPQIEAILNGTPTDRRSAILLARYVAEVENQTPTYRGYERAINLLTDFTRAKESRSEADVDLAAGYYNLACYWGFVLDLSGGNPNQQETAKRRAFEAIARCLAINPADADEARTDSDLDFLRNNEDFNRLVKLPAGVGVPEGGNSQPS